MQREREMQEDGGVRNKIIYLGNEVSVIYKECAGLNKQETKET